MIREQGKKLLSEQWIALPGGAFDMAMSLGWPMSLPMDGEEAVA